MKHEYRELKIWLNARALNKLIYLLSEDFPLEEKFGLKSQIRRASVSISSNIAEGSSHESNSMFIKYLNIAMGSLCEVESQLYLCSDLNFLEKKQLIDLIKETDKLKRMMIFHSKKH